MITNRADTEMAVALGRRKKMCGHRKAKPNAPFNRSIFRNPRGRLPKEDQAPTALHSAHISPPSTIIRARDEAAPYEITSEAERVRLASYRARLRVDPDEVL